MGWVFWAVGLGLFSSMDGHSGLGKQIGYAVLTGVGVGQTLQPSLIAIQAGVEKQNMAVVTGARNFIRNLGGTLGLAVAGTIINSSLRKAISSPELGLSSADILKVLNSPTTISEDGSFPNASAIQSAVLKSYQDSFRTVFLVGAGLAASAALLAIALMPQIDLGEKASSSISAAEEETSGAKQVRG